MEVAIIVQTIGLVTGPVVPLLLYILRKKNIELRWLLDSQLTNTWPKTLQNDLSNADELWFYGIHLKETIQDHYKLLQEKANAGKNLRFIIGDPEGSIFQMVQQRFHDDHGKNERDNAINTLKTLCKLKEKHPETVKIKKLDYLFPRTAYMVNPETDKAIAYISQHTFRLNNEKTKIKYTNGKGYNYDLLYREYKNYWNAAEPV